MQGAGYTVKVEAKDNFIGMQIERNEQGDCLLHQHRHECKLIEKYGIINTAVTPLPHNFSQTNYTGQSPVIPTRDYQRLVGDLIYLGLCNSAIPYALSALAKKTHYCTEHDYEAALNVLRYINGHSKEGLIFRRASIEHRPARLTDDLDLPISILFLFDGAHSPCSDQTDPHDQAGYFEKLYSWRTAAIRVVSKVQRITLSPTETELAALVLSCENRV